MESGIMDDSTNFWLVIICFTLIVLILGGIFLATDYAKNRSDYKTCLAKCMEYIENDNTLKLECIKSCNQNCEKL